MSDAALILALGRQSKNQELLARMLHEQGYTVETATDPDTFEALLSDVENPKLVIIDIDGYDEVIWNISAVCADKETSILVVASADADRVRAAAAKHEIDAVLSKPLDQGQLKTTIQSLL